MQQSVVTELSRIAVEELERILRAECALLLVSRRGCPRCLRLEREVAESRQQEVLRGVEIAVLDVEHPDPQQPSEPYALIFRCGRRVGSVAGASGEQTLQLVAQARTTPCWTPG